MAVGITLSFATQAIKAASEKVKLTHELEESIEQLKSIAKLLEINAPSPAALQWLSSLLRKSLLPLYNTFPILGIRYAVAVLATIFYGKVLPTMESLTTNSVANWEAVQASLLSGVLDHLESNPSYETRDIVANSFYPMLRNIFFPRTNPTFVPGPDLMYILCQVLSETVTLHPDNQAQLRNKDVLGGTNLGLILSQSRNILVIEALLELIVKLLPSKRTSAAARNEFVQDVFNISTFACGDVVSNILGTTSLNANWDVVFIEIIDLLGNTNPSFPQPFKTNNFRVQDLEKVYNVERLYVDHLGFVANIDEGDQIETLHALYASIENLKITAPRDGKTTVTILFSPPPSIGQVALVTPSGQWATVAFNIAVEDVARFLSSLKLRNVKNNIDLPGKKLSKPGESINFDFEPSKKNTMISTQDKGRDFARLWDLSNSQSRVGQALPTSPLMPRAASEVQDCPTLSNRGSLAKSNSPYYDSIFGTTDEELTDFDTERDPLPRRSTRLSRGKHLRSVGILRPEAVESDNESQIVRKVKSRRKTIVLSDAETDRIKSPQNTPETVKPASTEADDRCSFLKLKARSSVEGTLPDDEVADGVEAKVDQPTLKPNFIANSPQRPDSSPSCTGERPQPKRKRKSAGDNVQGPDSESPPSKRLRNRRGAAKTPLETKQSAKPVVAKRYVRNRGTLRNLPCSTECASGVVSVPSNLISKPKRKQNTVSTMKDKGGKKPTGRTASDKKRLLNAVEEIAHVAPSERTQTEASTISANAKGLLLDNTAIQDKVEHISKSTPKRSARIAKALVAIDKGIKMEKHDSAMHKTESEAIFKDERAIAQQVRLPKEPQRAPWNDISINQPSSTADTQNIVAYATDPPVVPTTASQDAIAPSPDMLGLPATLQEACIQDGSLNLHMLEANFVTSASCKKAKVESKQAKLETPRVLIDLTEDSPLLKKTHIVERKSAPRIKPPTTPPPAENIPNHQLLVSTLSLPSSPEPRHSSSKADRPRVSFAPSASFAIQPIFNTTGFLLESSDYSKEKENLFPSRAYRRLQSHAYTQKSSEIKHTQSTTNKCDADSMPKILGILDEINKVMKHKSSYRFNKVRKDLRAGEGAILRETAQHLEEIYAESAEHHNNFVNLETEYASYHRKIIQGLKDERENKEKTVTFLAATIQEHNRNSLSRRFPNSFFNSPLPSVLLNPQLKL